jgi:spore coat polysaccharide biosynthesis protein SpsF (cytidylyltransferase family)
LGEFSRANWGDKVDFREGRSVHVNTTSGLVAIVRKLEDRPLLWKKIIKAAVDASLLKKRSAGTQFPVTGINTEVSQDLELVDNDSE